MSQTAQKQWYALMSEPQQDAYAEEQLNNQGYTTYRPLAMREKNHRGTPIKVTESLFPRYMFIKLGSRNGNWAPIQSTYGVSDMVRFGDLPTPESLIDELKLQESQFQEKAIDLDQFNQGRVVSIVSSSSYGLNTVFERYDGEERVTLLMDILKEKTTAAAPVTTVYKTA